MNDSFEHPAPNKMVPILIGALAITATTVIPFLNLINVCCCAGVMGGAVLGVWFYKKNFPPDMPFTIGNGALIGTLSGLIAGALYSIVAALSLGMFSGGFSDSFERQMEESFSQMEKMGQNTANMEQARQFIDALTATPFLFFLIILVSSTILFTGFGALGGVIGGKIFKTPVAQFPTQLPPDSPIS